MFKINNKRLSKGSLGAGLAAAAIMLAAIFFAPGSARATESAAAELEYSVVQPLADRSVLLGITRAGDRLVAVGERGHVLLSDNNGESWRQIVVPTVVTLTSVYFFDDKIGWAVGHDVTILHTKDGGETWELQKQSIPDETPLFDIWFRTPTSGIAFGAYGWVLRTEDGGKTWEQGTIQEQKEVERWSSDDDRDILDPGGLDMSLELDDLHLNKVIKTESGDLFVAAEQGFLYRSSDNGQNWDKVTTPYNGSFWMVMDAGDGAIVSAGMRGNIFRSADGGVTWDKVATDTIASFQNGHKLLDGRLVVVGLTGKVLISSDGGKTFELTGRADRLGIADFAELESGVIVLVGEGGLKRHLLGQDN